MLQTQDLKVALDAELGLVKAIDGLTLAIQRGETFALVGESGCGKSMFRFEPSKAILVRGSFSTGFRAPTLYDINAAESYGTPGTVDDPLHSHLIQNPDNPTDPTDKVCAANTGYAKVAVCSIQPEVLNGGNKNLKPEKSKNATLGIVLEPVKGFTFGVDWFRVSYTNQSVQLPKSLHGEDPPSG